jgi:hypothetical protein
VGVGIILEWYQFMIIMSIEKKRRYGKWMKERWRD